MVIVSEKEQPLPPAPPPVNSPPPYAAQALDVQQQYLAYLRRQQQQQQNHNQQQPPQLQLQQQISALHSHQRARASTSPRTPSFPAPAYSTYSQLSGIPAAVMLKIVYATFPAPGSDPDFVRLRRTLLWLAMHLRAVNRAFYTACMHVLRSSYLPAYTQNVRFPYSSDPFPSSSVEQRETAVLDRWMLLKVREDVFADESELHLDLDAQRDVFDMLQPRARTEDLIRVISQSVRERIFAFDARSAAEPGLLPWNSISVLFEPRRIALVLALKGGRRKVVAETPRARDETLESSARKIIDQLIRQRHY